MPLVSKYSYGIQKTVYSVYPNVTLYQGVDSRSNAPISFAYAGFHQNMEDYWARKVLADGFIKKSLGQKFVWNLPSFLKEKAPNCNFFLVEHTLSSLRLVPSSPGFRIPRWVTMEIDITRPYEHLMGEQRLKTQRLIAQHGLFYEMSRSIKDFEEYYSTMFIPYIKGRYPDTSLEAKEIYEKIFAKGELILVKSKDKVLAGGLIEYKDNKAKLRTIGVRDGNREYVQMGALAAVYHGAMTEMKKRGRKKIDLGGARPFFSDGVTRYKVSLGAYLNNKCMHSCVWMSFLKDSLGLRNFLANNSFVFLAEEGRQHRAIFWEINEFPQQNEFDRILHESYTSGCEKTHLFIIGDMNGFLTKIRYAKVPWLIVKSFEEMFTFGAYVPLPQLTPPLMVQAVK
jgi:hypothetical protein